MFVDNTLSVKRLFDRLYDCSHINGNLRLVGLFIFCVILSAIANISYAQPPAAPKPSDVRLVIDISGSMKKNDPKNLRRPALDMLVQLLPKGSKSGIWSFGQQVNLLVPHQNVDEAWGKKASAAASTINSVAQFTNIGEALEKAAYDHKRSNVSHDRHVILLTDGMVDIDRDNQRNQDERQRILANILPLYQKANIKLHTIALSENADQQLLNKLAFATDGKVATANTAEELMSVFLQVFNQAVPMEEAPFDGEKFVVDSSIEEFTALIFRKSNAKDTQLVAPGGKVYTKDSDDSRVKWHHTNQYDLITVIQPVEGEWQVVADVEPQSRVTVVSDLSLSVKSMPTNITLNQVVNTSVALREENKIITRVEFLGLLDVDLSVTSPSGEVWNERLSTNLVPIDGVYSAMMNQFAEEGDYQIQLAVDGKSFKRQFSHQLSVRKMFAVEVDKKTIDNKVHLLVEVIPQINTVNTSATNILGEVTADDGQRQFIPFTLSSNGWSATIPADTEQDMVLSLNIKGVDSQQKTFDVSLDPLRLSHENGKATATPFFVPDNKDRAEVPVADPEPELVADAEPAEEAPVEDNQQWMQYVLYGVIGIVNLLILFIGYIIYRKLFNKKTEGDDEESDDDEEAGFSEPPMDEMAVEEIDESDVAAADEALEPDSPPEPDEASDDSIDNMIEGLDEMDDDDDIDESDIEVVEETPESDRPSEHDEVSDDPRDDMLEGLDEMDDDDDIDESDIEVVEETPESDRPSEHDEVSDDPRDDMIEGLDEMDDDDDMPEFSLDDFSPEDLVNEENANQEDKKN